MGRIFDAQYRDIKSLTNSLFRSPIRSPISTFAHQFAHQFVLLPYTLTNKSPHSSKVRSPIRSFVCSKTNRQSNLAHSRARAKCVQTSTSLMPELDLEYSCLNLASSMLN